ncbi:ubiquitin carboxyl-terminal hydrolase 22-like isoform X2 [Stegodyphus dumicola]|uniref:ubiquitin carboxyl-terminal hydrolase 22-like isoform X2 n=1 Tax=Stegodyphus dumicola TaxID=202533 RepID=UPI0015AF3927|nr:ubiquitin carboxyl-terminal hydrolase 22-like isoform X2 [Stegodyphus dumicola]
MSCCAHVDRYKEEKGTYTFRLIHAFFVACIAEGSLKRKAHCICYECKILTRRIHACLFCVYFGCYYRSHIHKHAEEKQHHLAMDTNIGTVYCFVCKDYMYDSDFEAISKKHMQQAARCMRLRGLVNMGNTCFVNCIVQALMHTPVLRDYFLAEKHICPTNDPSSCLGCEMARLFQEFYSGGNTPLILNKLIDMLWDHATSFASFEQQDAHECFIAILDLLHQHCKGPSELHIKNDQHCNCIIDQMFSGFLQSDITCLNCKFVSSTFDPFMGISLDLDTNDGTPIASTLFQCLERYTKPEHLDKKLTCKRCGDEQECTKQMTLKKLPVVTNFHLKRLSDQKSHKKITNFISFPECLDLTPFMASYACDKSSTCNGETASSGLGDSDKKFYLFAVVCHSGNNVGGHFITFVRQHKNKWFKCDDHTITESSIEEVLQSVGYILFYHKQILEYEKCDN